MLHSGSGQRLLKGSGLKRMNNQGEVICDVLPGRDNADASQFAVTLRSTIHNANPDNIFVTPSCHPSKQVDAAAFSLFNNANGSLRVIKI